MRQRCMFNRMVKPLITQAEDQIMTEEAFFSIDSNHRIGFILTFTDISQLDCNKILKE
jgi:hypothetical protein